MYLVSCFVSRKAQGHRDGFLRFPKFILTWIPVCMHYAIRLENQEGPYSKKVLAFPESKTRGQRKNWFVYVIVQVRLL